MKIHFDGLEFECLPVGRVVPPGPYDDWVPCSVRIRVPNFEGSFRWDAMAGEITSFVEELEAANRKLGQRKTVKFCSTEPNVTLEFIFNELGQIEGSYHFRGEAPGFEPRLTGSFSTDQTFVVQIVKGFRSILEEARSGG